MLPALAEAVDESCQDTRWVMRSLPLQLKEELLCPARYRFEKAGEEPRVGIVKSAIFAGKEK